MSITPERTTFDRYIGIPCTIFVGASALLLGITRVRAPPVTLRNMADIGTSVWLGIAWSVSCITELSPDIKDRGFVRMTNGMISPLPNSLGDPLRDSFGFGGSLESKW